MARPENQGLDGARPSEGSPLEMGARGARPSSSPLRGFIRPKGNLGTSGKVVLLLLACVPLLLVLCRIAAFPEAAGHGGFLAFLRPLGVMLNNHWSLTWLPATQRPTVLYLLMIPTGALII